MGYGLWVIGSGFWVIGYREWFGRDGKDKIVRTDVR